MYFSLIEGGWFGFRCEMCCWVCEEIFGFWKKKFFKTLNRS